MVQNVLHNLSIWIIVIPFLIGFMNYKGLNRDARWIFFLVVIALVPQLMTAFMKNDTPPFNVAYNLYTPIEFAVLYAVFITKFAFFGSRRVIQFSAILYSVVLCYFFIRFGISAIFLGGLVCVNNVIYMLWILLLLKQEYGSEQTIIEKDNPFTWFFISLILYAPCTVLTFALYQYIRDPQNLLLKNLGVIQDIFNIILYLFFSIGLLIRKI